MASDVNISQLATAVMFWLSYNSAVGRNYVLSEGAIKFPVSEFLERSNLDKIELEFSHPKLFKKRFDLYFKGKHNKQNVFEFKYIKRGSTRNFDEKQRVFDDLMRLFLYLEDNQIGYFLICGDQFQFISNFQVLLDNPLGRNGSFINPRVHSSVPITATAKGFYTKWFSFDHVSPEKVINIKDATGEHNDIYKNFLAEYSLPYEKKTNSKLQLPDSITTKLLFLSDDFNQKTGHFQPAKIGIWEIVKTR